LAEYEDNFPACRLCKSSSGTHVLKMKSHYPVLQIQYYEAYRCNDCGLIYFLPDPPESDIEMLYSGKDYLDLLFNNPVWRRWVTRNHWLPVLKAIENNISTGTILDMGCSDGLFMDLAETRGWDAYGSDLNREKLSIASQRHNGKVTHDSIYNLSWDNEQFDAIRLCHVLEHLPDPVKALKGLKRILRKDGILNIGIPVFDDSIYKLLSRIPNTGLRNKMIKNLGWMDPPHHLTIWSTGTIEKVLEDLGFSVIWKAYRSDVLPWIRNFRSRYIYFRLIGIPLKFLGSGASMEILAKNIG